MTIGLTIQNYLKSTYNALASDTTEIATGYTSKKLIYNKKVAYYGEYFTKVNEKKFIIYSMVFENSDNIYELALKSTIEESKLNRKIFGDVLFDFKDKRKSFFYRTDELEKSELIDLSKI